MLRRSTIQLLRFPFSLFLLPVFLFAVAEAGEDRHHLATWIVFAILHLLVYPASNGYNSYMDRDETPIGGLQKPLQPTRQLFFVTVGMDVLALALSYFLIGEVFAFGILIYILASRLYSYRRIRLKRFPVIGFLTVFIFQGAWIYFFVQHAITAHKALFWMLPAWASSCLIGALYPLTQIYQHHSDLADGVVTLSYKLGKRGSFVFSGLLFGIATFLIYLTYAEHGREGLIVRFLIFTLPVVIYFGYWMLKVWKNESAADFRHSLRMNIIASLCLTLYFLTLILFNF
ncbi:MAG: prenyltransferase [Chitinophagaceae bacterium]|nr:MAG: prenyltransferase [Chitinophagaceae bacterium]